MRKLGYGPGQVAARHDGPPPLGQYRAVPGTFDPKTGRYRAIALCAEPDCGLRVEVGPDWQPVPQQLRLMGWSLTGRRGPGIRWWCPLHRQADGR